MVTAKKASVQTESVRECRFYMRYMVNNFRALDREYIIENFSDTKICCRIINYQIRKNNKIEDDVNECITNLEFQYLNSIIPEDNFLWLKEDKRAAFWVWGELALNGAMNAEINKILGTPSDFIWYKEARLNMSPINHEQRYNLIIDVIDFICSRSSRYAVNMITWVNNKLIDWRKVQRDIIHVEWLTPDNVRGCFWAYEYIRDYQEANKISEHDDFYPVKIPIPLNAEEACLSFYALHDLWNADLELSLAVKERMMKTYTQRTWRKNKRIEAMHSQISDENMDKLKFLTEHFKISTVDVLNKLIEERFNGVSLSINNRLS
ncbi:MULTISPECIES: hypothetical protein [Enterobacterales]|nr:MULTISPECIES: hypothetical protein [Enterobacterales]ANZ89375.1 hypothetical protein CfB38_4477 [Citrobacter freundii]EJD6091709.1 hypothetical protein [Citrobacter freundii]TWY29680.1 hypothetical protein FR965_13145 [Serratia marcescens]HDW0182357.1 hypothetical protein [Enterobacter asburiae]